MADEDAFDPYFDERYDETLLHSDEGGVDFSEVDDDVESSLEHIGIKRKSGRYPWGSGADPEQRSRSFKAYMDEMKGKGLSEAQIAEGLSSPDHKVSTTDLRAGIAISTDVLRGENVSMATRLRDKGMSPSAIAKRMSTGEKAINESTVRGWLKNAEEQQQSSLQKTADVLRKHVEDKEFLDVGKGTHLFLGITDSKLRTSVAMLKDEGYEVHPVKLPQLGTDKMTQHLIMTKEGVSWHDAKKALDEGRVLNITDYSQDGGLTFKSPKAAPVSVNSKRIEVRYDEDGGSHMDGVIELRRGVPDLDLGAARYGQVRVAVDGTHYLKGMAMHSDDLPPGVDIRFNTNKSKHDPVQGEAAGKTGAMKAMKTKSDDKGNDIVDHENPFGASTYPRMYIGKDGKERQSALNIVGTEGRGNVEGRWDEWAKSLSSQMLSKQSVPLAKKQLDETRKKREDDLKEILSLTNPVVKKKLLDEYADSADSAAVHLKAAALPRQSSHVILPINSLNPKEIYAPNFKNGEKVVLVRYPHGGPFEIPELTVNNNNRQAKRILGGAQDAVGIHWKVAEQLSGADFDGDSVLVIPNNNRQVKARPPLPQLDGFDPKKMYPNVEGMTRMTKADTQREMGKISNLITDMTIKGANENEIARAVKHSMVVIDAEKHKLNYKQSEIDNGISELKKNYQGGATKGASTIISRASSDASVPHRKQYSGGKGVDPVTGEKLFNYTGNAYDRTTQKVNKRTGEVTEVTKTVDKVTKGTKMEFTSDARSLLSDNPGPMELAYAEHANAMKGLARQARIQGHPDNLKMPTISPAAKAVYASEVKSLQDKLRVAQSNAPIERRAQSIGTALAKARIDANPQFDKDDIKKVKYQSLEEARQATGATKNRIGSATLPLTAREWEAIQAGAVSSTVLREILSNADMARIRDLATPKPRTSLTAGQTSRIKTMRNSGRSMAEIADELDLPRSTVVDALKEG